MAQTTEHEFGRYIRRKRVDAHVSLRSAAKALNISAVYLGEVERGVRPPLNQEHWDNLINIIPTIDRDTLERLTVKSKPIQLDLRDSPPKYQDLGLALARRIDQKNISSREFEKLFNILGTDGGNE